MKKSVRKFAEAYLESLIVLIITALVLAFLLGPLAITIHSGNPFYMLLELVTIPLLSALGEIL